MKAKVKKGKGRIKKPSVLKASKLAKRIKRAKLRSTPINGEKVATAGDMTPQKPFTFNTLKNVFKKKTDSDD
jgi:hypothetical protein